ncbi:MAG: hypothetical protein NTV86_21975 [Planctomycetota bacterium]|nr:hypothetical protein [Planctomycetota bacterium]
MKLIEHHDIHKIYSMGDIDVPALNGVPLSIAPGKCAVPAGAGASA